MKISRPAIILLAASGIGVLLHFYLKKQGININPFIKESTASIPTASATIKKYATWIDRIDQLLKQSRKETGSGFGQVNDEITLNASLINKNLSDEELKKLVGYWQAVRNVNLGSTLDLFKDEKGELIALVYRMKQLNLL